MNREKQAYKQKVDAQLKEWDAKIELLKAKGGNLAADARLEFEKQMKNMETNKSEFKAYFDRVAERADDTWDDVKDEADKKWKGFANSVESFVSRF